MRTKQPREATGPASFGLKEAAARKGLKRLFPQAATNCFECNVRLTSSTRKRMVTVQQVAGGFVASGHQLCLACAEKLQTFPHLMRNTKNDLMAARFACSGESVKCVGGVQ